MNGLFGGKSATRDPEWRSERQILWRRMPGSESCFVVQSSAVLDLADRRILSTTPLPVPDLADAMSVRFDLVAFPSKKAKSKRRPISNDAGRRVWLQRRLDMAGLGDLDSVEVEDVAVKGLALARFTGLAAVRSSECLRAAVAEGVGPHKSWGAGLLFATETPT